MHNAHIEVSYNCKARLHTYVTRTGQRPPLPCRSRASIYNTIEAQKRQALIARFQDLNVELAACDKDDDPAHARDSYINIMTVISLPLL